MTDDEKHGDWIADIKLHGLNLTKWEEDFVESIDEQLADGRSLSERQAEILERIYAEKTP
jgi:hypothetical protein